MRVEVEHLPESQVQLQIEVDPEMFGQATGKAFTKLAERYRIPGFRPGKAPRAVLERAIGQDTLLSEATEICMNDAYTRALQEHDLHPLGQPDVEQPKSEEIAADKPFTFTAKVYVRPHVGLGDYQALRLAPVIPTITPEDVDRFLQSVQEEQAPWEPVEDRPAELGDLVTLRLLATVGEETLVDQDSWEYRLRDDDAPGVPIPGLSERIAGLRTGDTKDDTIDLPDSYTPAEYAGKQMTLHLEVLRVERKLKPEIDDAFARTLGKFETVEEMRAALTKSMQNQARTRAFEEHVEQVVQLVVDQAQVAAPPPLIDDELDEMMRQLQENVERERKISMDTYTRVIGKTVEQLREEARPTAQRHVQSDLVLDAVAEAEGIEAPAAEIDAQIRLLAGQPTYSTKERRRLLASDALRARIARRLRKRYVVNRLLEITNPNGATESSDTKEYEAHAGADVAGDAEPAALAAGGAQHGEAGSDSMDQQSEQEG